MTTIIKIIKRNLSLSFLRKDYHGYINDFINDQFQMCVLLLLRMDFSIKDYREKRIRRNLKTFQPTLWITTNAWISFGLLIYILIFPPNDYTIDLKFLEQLMNCQRFDLIVCQMIIAHLNVEWLWLVMARRTLLYRCSWVDFMTIDHSDDEQKLDRKIRKYMNKFHPLMNFITTSVYLVIVIIMMTNVILLPYYCLQYYQDGTINFIQYLTLFLMIPIYIDTEQMLGQLFVATKFQLFTLLFFNGRIKRLHSILLSLVCHADYPTYISEKIFWNRFHNEYIILHDEIKQSNETTKIIVFGVEIISKSAILLSCVFYSCQSKMVLVGYLFILFAIIGIFFLYGLYYQVASLPTHNEQCIRALSRWLARTQWSTRFMLQGKSRWHKNHPIKWRQSIKANLFVQMMTINRFGYTCGNLFEINKYKFFQLMLWNLPFILMFYKQIAGIY